ncbi:T9SS type A sorting domain-containing protein [Flavobacterium psychroterrae]|uniref:T9SS type A sorting domain-containing protein n=1 Tax=Flavobacterium psychroterrae TaxID=2133767 RepID=A0ABS5PE08_9FLAO|nr:T9SS sorting signal type C domain-containing protein [Flavobacterium psychroterrae]MBS7232528.1 T9SS type A sorting domain-containing protein [Flavobacterium psychroterrae]
MRLKLSLFAFFIYIFSWSQTTNTFTSSGSFAVAAGLTSVTAECWGAGGSGGGNDTSNSAGGGGGGYSKATITVTPNTSISYLVGLGAAGTTASGINGAASSFSTVSANGGIGGTSGVGGAAGIGGTGGTGTTFSGGKGSNGSLVLALLFSGGAGGSAGTAANGNNANGGAGGAAVAGGGAGGSGATLAGPGGNGAIPGGGGGLVLLGIGNNKGGNGGNGQIKVTYTCPTYSTTAATATNACATDGTSIITVAGNAANLPVGTYTVTYNTNIPVQTALSATMTVATAGTGTFTATGLTTVGTSTITITGLASGVCSSAVSATNTASVTILAASAGGSVAGGSTICSGFTSAPLLLSGQSGTVIKWQSSINPFTVWTDIASTAGLTTYTSGILTQTTQFRAVVQNGPCIAATSSVATVTVNTLPAAPIIGTITLPTCAVPTGTVALSGLPSGGTLTMNPGAIVKPYSGTTAIVSGLSANTYTFIVNNGTCTSASSTGAFVPGLITNTYTTSWSNGTPTVDQNIIFAGNYTSPGAGADITACSCTVNSGVNISIQAFDTLTLTNALINNGGTVTFQNNSSLLQTTIAVNVGNIVYKRTSSNIRLADFIYWSTPVNPQKLVDVSPLTLFDKYFGFDGTAWVPTVANSSMVVGKGYIVRGPQTYSTTVGADYTASFIGVPNNGNISAETVQTGNYYLVGNPYPSALKAETFLGANGFLNGTLYFWTHNTAVVFGPGYQYNSNDYASYNLSGGVATAPAPSGSIPGNNNNTPSGRIAAGQSFFVSANAPGTIAFNNVMRIGGANNNQFFKSETNSDAEIEAHRIWLNMTNDEGAFKQLLVAYIDGATNDYENRYDGKSFNANPYLDFYSVDTENNYVIQGRALPFQNRDVVPLGYRSTITGDFTIAIDHAEGDLNTQPVYLEDKYESVIHDLRESNYTFTTRSGTFNDRFVLKYTNLSLGVEENEGENNDLLIAVKDKIITINSFRNQNISTVFIYDLSGKQVYKKTDISGNNLVINNLKVQNQVLLVKVILDSQNIHSKKIIY